MSNESPDGSAPPASDDRGAEEAAEAAIPMNPREEFAMSRDAPRARGKFSIPLIAEELEQAESRWSEDSWQMKSIKFINSDLVQKFLVCLLLLDVLIVFSELAIDAHLPNCAVIIRDAISCCPAHHESGESPVVIDTHRFLAGGGGGDSHGHICSYPLHETGYEAGCDGHKHNAAHVAHGALFWLTFAILATFEVELLFLVYLKGPRAFCAQLVYVVDLFIVSASMILEMLFKFGPDVADEALPGILVFFRVWRFVRIGHGLVASTYEIMAHKAHEAIEHIELLEATLRAHDDDVPERPEHLKGGH